MTVEEAMILALSSFAEHVHAQWDLWANDDTGTLTAVHRPTGTTISAQVHDSGLLEYWAELPALPPIESVLETLVYVNDAMPPVELTGSFLVGEVDWGFGGGDFLPVMQ